MCCAFVSVSALDFLKLHQHGEIHSLSNPHNLYDTFDANFKALSTESDLDKVSLLFFFLRYKTISSDTKLVKKIGA